MTLPASGTISLGDVLTEIRIVTPARALPISLGDADVIALAGKAGLPVSLSDLYGKSSYIPMTLTGHNDASAAYTGGAGSTGTVSCSPSVTVAGGSGGNTYTWSFTSNPDGLTLGNATAPACTVSFLYLRNDVGTGHAVLQCVVGDSTSHSATIGGVTADLSWSP